MLTITSLIQFYSTQISVKNLKSDLSELYTIFRLQIQLRKATLLCEEAVQKGERDILFDSGNKEDRETELRHRSRENLVHSASNVTENLVHIREMMATSLNQSEATTEILGIIKNVYIWSVVLFSFLLAGSSTTVSNTHEELKSFSTVVSTSRNLMNKYNRRELTDRLLICVGLLLFFSSVLYVVTKRLFPSMLG